jgi:hypothetical protein
MPLAAAVPLAAGPGSGWVEPGPAVRRPRVMRTSGTRFTAAGFLVVAGLLASCSAAHVRPGTQSRPGTRSQASRPSVLAPGTVSRDRKTQTYRAASPGHAVLVSGAVRCMVASHPEIKQAARACPVVTVTVVPRTLPVVP